MMYPPLDKDHEVFGQNYCSGYTDKHGKWNTGFYCPSLDDGTLASCCGTSVHKYCCTGKVGESSIISSTTTSTSGGSLSPSLVELDVDVDLDIFSDYEDLLGVQGTVSPSPGGGTSGESDEGMQGVIRNSYVAAVICGLVLVSVLMTLVACFYCKCCLLYKKRRRMIGSSSSSRRIQLTGGLMQCQIPSCGPGSGGAFMHSNNSPFVPTTGGPVGIIMGDPWSPSPPSLLNNRQPPTGLLGLIPTPAGGGRMTTTTTGGSGSTVSTSPFIPIQEGTSRSPPESYSSVSTISSSNFTRQQQPSSNPTTTTTPSRTNNNSSSTERSSSIALRLQRQLLQAQQLQNQTTNLSRSASTAFTHNLQRQGQGRQGQNQNIYTLGGSVRLSSSGRSSNPSNTTTANSALNLLLNSVSFTSGLNSNSSSLPPPYFVEQYRIRNRVRVPRGVQQGGVTPLNPHPPSYNEIQEEQQGTNGNASSSSSTRQPQHQLPPRRPRNLSMPMSSPARCKSNSGSHNPTTPTSPLNDLSAPTRKNLVKGGLETTNVTQYGDNNVHNHNPSLKKNDGKILNTSSSSTGNNSKRSKEQLHDTSDGDETPQRTNVVSSSNNSSSSLRKSNKDATSSSSAGALVVKRENILQVTETN